MMILAALLAVGATTTPAPVTPAVAQAQTTAAERPSRADVLAAVKAEWSRYDTTGRGKLTPLEFSTWVMRAHGAAVAPRAHAAGISPVSAMNASSTAFARADADHDGGITPDEMVRFLMLPPPPARPKAPATVATTRAAGEP
jgi:hypothetical protein